MQKGLKIYCTAQIGLNFYIVNIIQYGQKMLKIPFFTEQSNTITSNESSELFARQKSHTVCPKDV